MSALAETHGYTARKGVLGVGIVALLITGCVALVFVPSVRPLGVILGTILVLGWLTQPLSISVGPAEVLLRYPLWTRRVALADLSHVALDRVYAGHGSWLQSVRLDRPRRRSIQLYGFPKQTEKLSHAILDARYQHITTNNI